MDTPLIGRRYRLLDRLGVGGMATVWRARDERSRETVAVKRLHPHVVSDPAARARLEREAAALRTVDHPAIVRPRELVEDPEAPVLVMDLAAGRPLDQRIAQGPLLPGEAVAITTIVADALAAAHEQAIVHRDIKPSNILVDSHGAVHLVDFGIAALVDDPADALTVPAQLIGTLRYTPPERLAGEPATPRSDVWALGAVLYEMLTGRPAVAAGDPAGAVVASQTLPGDLDALPAGLAPIVARAMAPDPAARFADAAAFRDALTELEAPVDPDAATQAIAVPRLATGEDRDARPSPATGPVAVQRPGGAALVALALVIGVGALATGLAWNAGTRPLATAPLPGVPSPVSGGAVEATPESTEKAKPTAADGEKSKAKGEGKGKGHGRGPR